MSFRSRGQRAMISIGTKHIPLRKDVMWIDNKYVPIRHVSIDFVHFEGGKTIPSPQLFNPGGS